MDGNTVGGNSLCANCGWRWNKCIATREEFKKVLFMNWVKQYDRPLCWLCAQVCPFLQDGQKDPHGLCQQFESSWATARQYRRLKMLPPCDPLFSLEAERDSVSPEIWRDPFSPRNERTTSTSNIFAGMIAEAQRLRCDMMSLRTRLDQICLEYGRQILSKKNEECVFTNEEASNAASSSDRGQNRWSTQQDRQSRSGNFPLHPLPTVHESENRSNDRNMSHESGSWTEDSSWRDSSSWRQNNRWQSWNSNGGYSSQDTWDETEGAGSWNRSYGRPHYVETLQSSNNSNARQARPPRVVWDPPPANSGR